MMKSEHFEEVINFNRGVPPPESFPKEALAECAREVVIESGDLVLQYGSPSGYFPLKEWIAAEHHTQVSNVILGQGSLQLLDHLVQISLRPDDLVFVEQPSYDRVLNIFKRADVRMKGYDLRNGEMDLAEIEKDLRKGLIPKYFYVIPDFQNPSGSLMGKEHRVRLVELANLYGFYLIEDGPYRHLRYTGEPLPRLHEMDAEHVLHMSSFSKLICPGIRVGYMVAEPDLVERIAKRAEDTYISPSLLDQAIVDAFIKRGLLQQHLVSLKQLYAQRLETILLALKDKFSDFSDWITPEGGFFVGIGLAPGITLDRDVLFSQAKVMLSDNRKFFLDGGDHFMRLPFCALQPEQIREGIDRLKNFLSK